MLKSNSFHPVRMPDATIEAYINTVFQCTSRKERGTAPIEEWWELLPMINMRENYYILTPEEINELESYCMNNQKLEMTPQEFTRLIGLVRDTDSEIQDQQVEITPQMSISASLRRDSINYYEDGESLHHPEPPYDDIRVDLNDRRMIQSQYESMHNPEEIRKLKKDKADLLVQLQDNDKKIQEMGTEHLERISQLETKIQYLNVEKEKQKALTNEHLQKERERLDKITELQNDVNLFEEKYSICSKKLSKKEEEIARLQEKLKQIEKETNQIKESTKSREIELRQAIGENTKLMEIIDKQKFDLDEARSGLNHFYSNGKEQDELESEYIERFNQTKKERDIFKHQSETNEAQIRYLSLQLDRHHQITNDIKMHISSTHSIFLHPLIQSLAYISWIYFSYHIFLLTFAFFTNRTPFDPLLKNIDLWLHYHYIKN